jgi:hypothetical protein
MTCKFIGTRRFSLAVNGLWLLMRSGDLRVIRHPSRRRGRHLRTYLRNERTVEDAIAWCGVLLINGRIPRVIILESARRLL